MPISLSFQQLADHLEIFPLFSRQAKVYLRNILNYLESAEGTIINFTHLYRLLQKKFDALRRDLKLHKGTLENIERALNFIAGSEEVDVSVDRRVIGMPPARVLAENYRGPMILDLDYAFLRGAHFLIINMIAYEFMRSMYVWKKVGGGATKPVVLILDEAHRFFPSEGTLPEEVELLADFIARVARLGRARGLGLVFSTHSPRDVHKIVIQLANTKVVFRSRKEYLELLDVPKEYYRIIELAPDRVALISTPTIRIGYALFRTPEPLLGHFDLGRVAAGASLK
ncbi:MAG: ATP-binding protein [Desulfurococcales archaeon]|nr:ATP-binding protein [Desulfurococcales archaeon]